MVDIKGLDRAKVLKALYDHSHIQGLGFLQAVESFTEEDARKMIEDGQTYFDYVYGKVIKVRLEPDAEEFDERLYDRDCGQGAAQRAIDSIR